MSEEKRGPVAPKDPTKKRSGFYIMQNKSVAASPQPDGHGIQFIYEDNGRLQSSAKLVGNVTDQTMLDLLMTTEGIRKMVHSVGVSVRTDGEPVNVHFAFQMYGHKDPYKSGTTLEMDLPSDGMEMVLDFGLSEWSDDDNIPGQIRFEFEKPGTLAQATVMFYLNDGFEAPPQKEDHPVDFASADYKAIIAKSLLQQGNNARIKAALDKARRGEDTTIAFIGGSITQGAGAIPINTECYAYRTFTGFCELAGKGIDENIHYVKAGVGGTPSELGMLRYEMDVLDNGKITPDVVVVEFAVNDEGDETKGECYDSLVRKIYNGPGKPAVILLFAVFANDWNLEERLSPVGAAYQLPMVSTRQSVVEQFYKKDGEGHVVSKNQYFYDMYHPTNTGHRIMADGILHMLALADAAKADAPIEIDTIPAPIGGEFETVKFVDRTHEDADTVFTPGSFSEIGEDLQRVERNLDLKGTPEFPNNWFYRGTAGGTAEKFVPFVMDTVCSALILSYMDSASPLVGVAQVYVDGELKLEVDPHIVGWMHCNPLIVFRGGECKKHHVEVRMKAGDEDKDFTILGFGIVK